MKISLPFFPSLFSRGVTLRDLIAFDVLRNYMKNTTRAYSPNELAAWAYEVADAMLEARSK